MTKKCVIPNLFRNLEFGNDNKTITMKSCVSIVRCQNYDEGEVLERLRKAIDLLGGIEQFVQKGNRVLLKPNLLYGEAPEKAVTTHPSIVKGMIKIVREGGGIPFIGDSPAVAGLLRTAEKAGIKRVADEMNCPLVNEFDRPVLSAKGVGKHFKQFEIDQAILEVDVIINLPKWKTHGNTLLTLGVKNLFGCIPGSRKALWHLRAGALHADRWRAQLQDALELRRQSRDIRLRICCAVHCWPSVHHGSRSFSMIQPFQRKPATQAPPP